MNNKKLIKSYFIIVICGLLLVGIFNYKIDSLSIFGTSKQLLDSVKLMQSGYGVKGIENINDRLLQKVLIQNSKVTVDTIVLGSSRVMYLDKKYISNNNNNNNNNKVFFNHWMSGANLNDYMSIIGLYKSHHNYIPRNIILAIDPWVFNKYTDKNKSEILYKYYSYIMTKLKLKINFEKDKLNLTTKYKELFNYEYTKENIIAFKKRIKNKDNVIKQIVGIKNENYRTADGNMHTSMSSSYPKKEIVSANVSKYISGGHIGYLDRFYSFSNKELFEIFINYLKINNIQITFLLLPFHPMVYNYFDGHEVYNKVLDVEVYLKKYAVKHNINIYGSYNPAVNNYDNSYFTDAIHSVNRVIENIVRPYSQEIKK